ncbi:dirigent protein 11-like [Elaeis guineensis]|uniref:Dirigent protein n=1 Tax=Elaeis guineensis var. tenera TaxID=51953 RepID=A0A6I9R6Q7_ELAGV|nr:dirigent protein 11-like [Elaeis guineensis]
MPNSSNTPNLFLLSTATLLFVAYALHRRMPKQTNLVLYVHDYFSGDAKSATTVAGKLGAASNILQFGTIAVVDDVVTEGPEVDSKVIGRAQGLYVNSALDGTALYMVFSVTFTEGRFKGSTLEIQGADPFKLREREFGVVSGTGFFRFAKGYGIMETQHMDVANLRAIIKLNITVRND